MKIYGSVRYAGGKWIIKAEPHVNLRLKDLFRQIYKGSVGTLELTCNPQTSKDLEWFMMRYPMNISEKDLEILIAKRQEFDTKQESLERILLPDYKAKQLSLAKPARPYQSQAVDLLIGNGALLCGDDVGLGKTVVGIAAAVAAEDSLPALVVCQTHLPNQWAEKCAEFAPQLKVHVIKTTKPYNLPDADIYIISYSKISRWSEVFCVPGGFFKLVIFDEIQELRRKGSQKYDCAARIAQLANYKLGLSATPVYNYGGEIYNIMNILSPGCLGTFSEFVREWCSDTHYGDDKIKVKDPKALGSYLRENYLLIRRTRQEVGRELPPVNKIVHEVEYDEKYTEKKEKELKEIANRVISGSFIERGQAARMLDVQARMMTGIAKAHAVAEYVKVLVENGEKVLLVGWHREVYDIWNTMLADYNPVMYTGSESPTQKDKNRDKFINGESKVMIMSLRAGVGLDGLQECANLVVFGELDWSPGVHEQVIGRLARDGQDSQVTAIFLTTSSGTDPLMIDVLGLKSSQAQGIMNPQDEGVLRTVSNDERIKMLAENILNRK